MLEEDWMEVFSGDNAILVNFVPPAYVSRGISTVSSFLDAKEKEKKEGL